MDQEENSDDGWHHHPRLQMIQPSKKECQLRPAVLLHEVDWLTSIPPLLDSYEHHAAQLPLIPALIECLLDHLLSMVMAREVVLDDLLTDKVLDVDVL